MMCYGMNLRHMLMNEVGLVALRTRIARLQIPLADGKNMVCNVFNEEMDGKHDSPVTLMRRRIG